MISYPFDSQITGYEADGSPIYDRAADSSVLRKWMSHYFTDGVFSDNGALGFTVLQGDGMTVTVSAGSATIRGAIGIEDSVRTLALSAADTTYDRIDTVVARLNLENDYRSIDLYIVPGTAASAPMRPELTRNLSIWELGLADIKVGKNSSQVQQANITDTRLDADRCGIVASPLVTLDTTAVYNQIMSDIAARKQEASDAYDDYLSDMDAYQAASKNDFDTWFQNLKEVLGGDIAGNLQLQIEQNTEAIRTLAQSIRVLEVSLPVTSWTGGGPYVLELAEDSVTENTDCRFEFGETQAHIAAAIDWETTTQTITLTTQTIPTGELAGRVILMEVSS